jgi:ribosomal protein L1
LARVLGPKGLFPNAKTGTLVSPTELENTIKTIKSGQIELKSTEQA